MVKNSHSANHLITLIVNRAKKIEGTIATNGPVKTRRYTEAITRSRDECDCRTMEGATATEQGRTR